MGRHAVAQEHSGAPRGDSQLMQIHGPRDGPRSIGADYFLGEVWVNERG